MRSAAPGWYDLPSSLHYVHIYNRAKLHTHSPSLMVASWLYYSHTLSSTQPHPQPSQSHATAQKPARQTSTNSNTKTIHIIYCFLFCFSSQWNKVQIKNNTKTSHNRKRNNTKTSHNRKRNNCIKPEESSTGCTDFVGSSTLQPRSPEF